MSCGCERAQETAFANTRARSTEKRRGKPAVAVAPSCRASSASAASGAHSQRPLLRFILQGKDSRTSHKDSALSWTPSRPYWGGRSRHPCESDTAAWHPCSPSARRRLKGVQSRDVSAAGVCQSVRDRAAQSTDSRRCSLQVKSYGGSMPCPSLRPSESSVPKLGAYECLQPMPVGEVGSTEQTLGKLKFEPTFWSGHWNIR